MTHDFDAAIEYVESACPSFSPRISEAELNAILFALKFTKAALSGEVSDKVEAAGEEIQEDGNYLIGCSASAISVFKAMCAELAKEVGE